MSSLHTTLPMLLLAASILACDGARMKAKMKSKYQDSINSCPENVQVNTKGDCIDSDGAILAEDCCDHIQDCDAKIGVAMKYYVGRTDIYLEQCEVKRSDLKRSGNDFAVADDTRVCSDLCQSKDVLKESSRSLISWGITACEFKESYQQLLLLSKVAVGLDYAWSNCEKTYPPTPSPTPSPELGYGKCTETPAAVCNDPGLFCYYDETCLHKDPRLRGLGCNAGGVGQNCRFCGGREFHPCPTGDFALGVCDCPVGYQPIKDEAVCKAAWKAVTNRNSFQGIVHPETGVPAGCYSDSLHNRVYMPPPSHTCVPHMTPICSKA